MKTMHLFRISYQDLGPNILLVPEVPHYRLDGEDGETPRVCACPTLYQCIMAKSIYLNSKLWKENKLNFYVYTADVPIDNCLKIYADNLQYMLDYPINIISKKTDKWVHMY